MTSGLPDDECQVWVTILVCGQVRRKLLDFNLTVEGSSLKVGGCR